MGKFKHKLYNIMDDLNKMGPRFSLMESCIQRKLDNSYDLYNKEIERICMYLLSRSNSKVIRTMSKENAKEIEGI